MRKALTILAVALGALALGACAAKRPRLVVYTAAEADGFAHAEALRRERPAAFEILAFEPVRFTFREASGAAWSARYPVLEMDGEGTLRAVRVNHRSLDLEPRDADAQDAWCDALSRLLPAPARARDRARTADQRPAAYSAPSRRARGRDRLR